MEKSIHSHEYSVLLSQLKGVRESRNVTQLELAARLNTSQSFISKLERGERRIDVVELKSICEALGVPFQKFISQFERALVDSR